MMKTTANLANSDLFAVLLILLTLIMVVYYIKAILYYRKTVIKSLQQINLSRFILGYMNCLSLWKITMVKPAQ